MACNPNPIVHIIRLFQCCFELFLRIILHYRRRLNHIYSSSHCVLFELQADNLKEANLWLSHRRGLRRGYPQHSSLKLIWESLKKKLKPRRASTGTITVPCVGRRSLYNGYGKIRKCTIQFVMHQATSLESHLVCAQARAYGRSSFFKP